METITHRPTWKTLLAFAIIYFVWGSTFLAIRVGVREVPPFLLAAMRFFVAGLVSLRLGYCEGRALAEQASMGVCVFACNRGLRPGLRIVVLG
jgi:drug/metabolite transporter (DMT)-like permease